MAISIRKVDPVKAFRQPDAAIGSHQTTPAQLTADQEDGPEVNMPLPVPVAESVLPSPLVAESPVLSELRNTSHVVPLAPVGAGHQGPLGHQVIHGAPAPMASPFERAASYFRLHPAQAAVLCTETARSEMSCPAVPDNESREPPMPATMAFESTYLPSARSDRAQHTATHPSSSFASASVGACPDCVADAGVGPWMQTPSTSVHDLLPPMDFIFYKDSPLPPAPAEPVPDWKNTREISVKADTFHVQSLEHLALQIQDLVGSQMKLNTELRELKQQVYSNCQDLDGIRREAQNRFVAPSLRYSLAPSLSPPPVLSTQQQPADLELSPAPVFSTRQPPENLEDHLTNLPASPPTSTSMTSKNLGYDNTEDMLANVRGHAARGMETLHRHTARAVQHFSDSSWLASMGRLSCRSS